MSTDSKGRPTLVEGKEKTGRSQGLPEPDTCECFVRTSTQYQAVHAQIPAMRQYILDHACSCGFDEEELDDIRIAVSEACTNAVNYGSPFGSDNSISIECHCVNTDFVVEIRDEGVFQPMAPQMDPEMSMNGRGLLLMLSLMDKVTFDENPTGTLVRMTKRHPLLPLL